MKKTPIRILLGGFPCTNFSIAQKSDKRETSPYSGDGWYLFENFLISKQKFKPHFFLAENNYSMAKEIKEEISKLLECDFIPINSDLVSAQNRKRIYWTNIPGVTQPEDRHIYLKDIINSGVVDREKSLCLTASYCRFKGSQEYYRRRYFGKSMGQIVFEDSTPEYHKYLYSLEKNYKVKNIENIQNGYVRPLTAIECEKLQTMPLNYTAILPEQKRKEVLGNGWTAEVIKHILKYLATYIDKDYPIEVLSMYDGIGTGMYVLESLGFTNIIYKAYEIDKSAIECAKFNYPNIIECGNANNIKLKEWRY